MIGLAGWKTQEGHHSQVWFAVLLNVYFLSFCKLFHICHCQLESKLFVWLHRVTLYQSTSRRSEPYSSEIREREEVHARSRHSHVIRGRDSDRGGGDGGSQVRWVVTSCDFACDKILCRISCPQKGVSSVRVVRWLRPGWKPSPWQCSSGGMWYHLKVGPNISPGINDSLVCQ